MPQHLAKLKEEIIGDKEKLKSSWKEVLDDLKGTTTKFQAKGSQVRHQNVTSLTYLICQGSQLIPEVNFSDLENLSLDDTYLIKHRGCVIIRNVVDREQAQGWKARLQDHVQTNPVRGTLQITGHFPA